MFETENYELLNGNALDMLKTLPDCCVQTCITSPPYFGLRDYGTGHWVGGDPNCEHKWKANRQTFPMDYVNTKEQEKAYFRFKCPLCGAIRVDEQIGLEETPEEYIGKLVEVFHEVKRVLKDDGTLWINIGDSYAGGAGRWGGIDNISEIQSKNKGSITEIGINKKWQHPTIKQKDLIGIPWMLAFALRNDGWYLRQDIIWHKPNPMPESVTDRCTKSHEYMFLLSKNPTYYFDHDSMMEDAVLDDKRPPGIVRDRLYQYNSKRNNNPEAFMLKDNKPHSSDYRYLDNTSSKRNRRDVWTINVSKYKEAHFATFPEKLVEPCILAGARPGDVVMDVFNGSGTTGAVAINNDRKYIGIELNKDYIDLTIDRFDKLKGIDKVVDGDDTIKVRKAELF